MFIQKSVVRGVAAVFAVGAFAIAQPALADAGLTASSTFDEAVQCKNPQDANVPVTCTTAGATRYRLTFVARVDNPNVVLTPAAVSLTTDLAAMFTAAGLGADKWAVVAGSVTALTDSVDFDREVDADNSTPVGTTDPVVIAQEKANDNDTVELTVNPGFNGGTNPVLATGDLPSKKLAMVRFTVEVDIAGATSPTFENFAAGLSGTDAITSTATGLVFLPATVATPVGTTCTLEASAVNLISNPNFAVFHTGDLPASSNASALLANSFYSDVPLESVAFNEYRTNKSISMMPQSLVASTAQQHPLPGGATSNWLRHGGGAVGGGADAPQQFWKQQVSGLTVGRDYQFSAYFSNITPPGRLTPGTVPGVNDEPIMRFLAGGTPFGSDYTVAAETFQQGDVWTKVHGVFKATATTMELAVSNQQAGGWYNQVGMTGLDMKLCTMNSVVAPPSTNPGDSTPPPTTTSTGGGGGGGAAGFGLLALLGLPALIRRRIR